VVRDNTSTLDLSLSAINYDNLLAQPGG
jgi:hypothetical protein